MLTEDEIKRLKNGDKLLAEVKFSGLDDNGEVRVFTDDTAPNGEPMESYYWFEQFELSIPPDKPKHDPCRRFKKGDIVQRRKVLEDRDLSCMMHDLPFDTKFIVISDEKNASVGIDWDDDLEWVSWALLELVIPVELEPYSIDTETTTDILKDGEWYAHMCDGDEAERLCKWLNDKWRKEQ